MDDINILATVALALAVLAFSAQLVVSLAQAQGTASQVSQTERINSDTQVVLADVRSTSRALLTNQSELFDKLLSAALPSATEAALREIAEPGNDDTDGDGDGETTGAIDYEEVANRVEEKVRLSLREWTPDIARSLARSQTDESRPGWVDAAISPDEAAEVTELIADLTSLEVALFTRSVARRLPRLSTSARSGVMVRSLDENVPLSYRPLVERGLYDAKASRPLNSQTRYVLRLTAEGELLAKMLLGRNFGTKTIAAAIEQTRSEKASGG